MIPFKLIAVAAAALLIVGGSAVAMILPSSQIVANDNAPASSTVLNVLSTISSKAGGLILHPEGTDGLANPDQGESTRQGDSNSGHLSPITGGAVTLTNTTKPKGATENITQSGSSPESSKIANATITVPANGTIFAEATGKDGAKVAFSGVAAVNASGQSLPLSCNPPSNSQFALGVTKVVCSANDHGKTTSARFVVVVRDTVPPSLVAPKNIVANATGALTDISLGYPAVKDAVDPSPSVSNNAPLLGFHVGATTVTWEATDSSGNTRTAQQTVTIINSSSQNVHIVPESSGAEPDLVLGGTYYNDSANGRVFVGPLTAFAIEPASGAPLTEYHYRYYPAGDNTTLPGFANGSTFTISGSDGNYIVQYYGHSAALVKSLVVTFDGSPPVSAASIVNNSAVSAADDINITSADRGSGLAGQRLSGIYYSVDGNHTFNFSSNGTVIFAAGSLKPGSHTLTFYSIDNVGNKASQKTIMFSISDCSSMPTGLIKGVVFADQVLTTTSDGQPLLQYNAPPIDARMSNISSEGFNTIKVPYFWSAYSDNRAAVLSEMSKIASSAQTHKLCVIFSNYQTNTGGKFGGHGFPLSLTKFYSTQRTFWTQLYDNNILTDNGPETVWNLQAAMMSDVISSVDKYPSTTGYELITSPYIYETGQYAQLGQYQTYIASQMRVATEKVIFFDKAEPLTGYSNYVDLELDNLTKPSVSNVVFAPHVYEGAAGGTTSAFDGYAKLAGGWNCPLIVGEWADSSSNSTRTDMEAFGTNGAGWIWWSYDPIDSYSLMDADYKPTKNMAGLLAATN